MSDPKFSVGEKVIINPNLIRNQHGEIYAVTSDMYNWRGRVFTVSDVFHGDNTYHLKESDGLGWHEEWLQPVSYLSEELFEI